MIFIDLYYDEDSIRWKKIYWKNGEITKYSISNIGLVRNDLSGSILKTNFFKGYERLDLRHNGKRKQFFVHRLVATAFIPNPENKPEVNHKNGDKSCNYDFNLEWVTQSENTIHAYKNGLISHRKGNSTRTTEDTINKICMLLEENKLSLTQIAKKVGATRDIVSRIQKKKSYLNIIKNYNIDNYDVKTNFSKYGDDSEKTKYPDKDIIEVCELIDEGFSLPDIARITDVSYQTIRNVYYGTCRKSISKNYKFMKNRICEKTINN